MVFPVVMYRCEFSSVQFSHSVSARLFATPWTIACQASLSITNCQSLPKPMSIESVMPSNHLILYCPLLLLPPILPSIRVSSNESALRIRWPKYWSFSFNISHESWTIKKAECQRIDSFKLWCWRTLESLLDCKDNKPVNPNGNQPWIFIGRTDAEADAPILCPPDAKNKLIWKGSDSGKDWWWEEKGVTEDEMAGWFEFE